MIPYFALILVPLLCCFIAFDETQSGRILVGQTRDAKERSIALPVFFILLTLLLALRSETLGRDLPNYRSMFESYSNLSFSTVFNPLFLSENDWLYVALNLLFSKVSHSFQLFVSFVAVITILPIAFLYCQDRKHSAMQIAVFLSLSNFIMFFSGLRQSLAISVGVIAYHFVKTKRLIPFLVCVIIAMSFHHSGIVLLFMYPIFHVTLRRKHLLLVIPVVVLILVFNKQIFTWLDYFLVQYSEKYVSGTTDTGAYGSLILWALFTAFCFGITDEREMTPELNGLRNIVLLCLTVQCFAPIHNLAMRLNYYYMIFTPVALSKCVSAASRKNRQIAYIGEAIIVVFFTIYFLWVAYRSSVTGISALDNYPYRFFWQT